MAEKKKTKAELRAIKLHKYVRAQESVHTQNERLKILLDDTERVKLKIDNLFRKSRSTHKENDRLYNLIMKTEQAQLKLIKAKEKADRAYKKIPDW